ncbi:Signal transduction histidine kinase [Sporobacter termitidis DSM 10068]|uniref:histidine kinase n=1 Tax=Sporobacter termitidis DSM 10068 TaxID=1123282 RepID=A0A1M5VNN1_9FIRM|nr:HAMP domain-containing sensor histidine kinase [Sporobacter termitidis]SHH76849.1 Signal transduction histidine kinase [Sporobacter termitidis DSM 10068]
MKKSIYIRNFYTTASIVFLSFLILGSVFVTWSYRLVVSEKQKAMAYNLDEVANLAVAFSEDSDLSDVRLRMFLTSISHGTGFEVLLAYPDGTVASTSDPRYFSPQLGKIVPGNILSQIKSGKGFSQNTNLDGIYDEVRYVMGVALVSPDYGKTIGYVFLSGDSTDTVHLWRQFAGVFLFVSAIVLLVVFIVSFITTKKQAKPLNEMALAARRFARGDFSTRVNNEDCRVDEIGELTDAFNTMADSLERSESLRRDFIANVSHELKTPMTVISGFSDGILDGTIPPENEKKYLEVISSETKRLSRLVKTMLDMSRIQSASAESVLRGTFDIAEVIRLALLSLGGKIDDKGLDVDAELPEEAIVTRGDKDAITQVVYNLIDNAVKFAEKGSAIRLALWKQGHKAYVSVENKGETIPAEEMPLIFDRFHKTDRSRSENRDGVGLGLYIVKTILDNHNEDIFVTSSDGVTKFTFTLKLAAH